MNKFGYHFDLEKMSKLLKRARIEAGKAHGQKWLKTGKPKPYTQPQAAEEIDITMRSYCRVENCERNISDKYKVQRILDFINRYLFTDYQIGGEK